MNSKTIFERIASRFPEAEPALTEFPSGAFMIDLVISGVRYCVEYLPTYQALGLSKTANGSPFFEGFDESFPTPDELGARISELVGQT